MIDAWGKPPSGILHGRFKWPGEMNECHRIKADRRSVQPDGTVITKEDGIKGAWSTAYISIDAGVVCIFTSSCLVLLGT